MLYYVCLMESKILKNARHPGDYDVGNSEGVAEAFNSNTKCGKFELQLCASFESLVFVTFILSLLGYPMIPWPFRH